MGNANVKSHPIRQRNKKQVHWKAADRPAPPSKPRLSESDEAPDVLRINWDRPLKDGGSPVTGYLVEHRRTGSTNWVRTTPKAIPMPDLTLGGLEPGWRYQFRIFAENVVGISDPSDISEPITVTLQKSAITAPRFLEELSDTTALENEKVEFVAHYVGQPTPKICWFKDGFEIFSSRRTRIITEPDRSVLVIHQSALSDEGEIKCTATNRAGHASTKAKLTLEAPPSIRLPRQYEDGLLFEIGELMRLKVSVAGRPTPLVFWSHNGESIQNNERYEIEDSEKASVLKIGDARRSDRGEYQIKAVNQLGEDVTSFLVTVTDKPSPPGKARVVMTLGRSVTLAWNTPEDDGGCKIGNYIVEYYRLGWNVWLKAATTRQLTTILGDLIEGSEYKFRVKAESPYGISDPSEESDLIFIPDPKRGMVVPPPRSKSQPRDDLPPVAAKRKKVRSQSSSRAETPNHLQQTDVVTETLPPIRPQRTKTKSTPASPEPSPVPVRKPTDIHKQFFDRSSMAREMAYGSPEIKMKRSEQSEKLQASPTAPSRAKSPSKTIDITTSFNNRQRQKSKSPSPQPEKSTTINANTNKKETHDRRRPSSPGLFGNDKKSPQSPREHQRRTSSPGSGFARDGKSPSPSKDKIHNKSNLKNRQENFGSSEFMLVLMPNESKHHGSQSDLGFDLDGVPPPLSLSSPELGVEPPMLDVLIRSASSTELLHERAMIRFYKEAEAEEAELQKRKERSFIKEEIKQSIIPRIQINSKDTEDVVGLERKHSIRRRLSAGGTIPQQIVNAQRRLSLRNSADLSDIDIKIKSGKISEELTTTTKKSTRTPLTPKNSIEEETTEEHEYDEIYSGDSSEDERFFQRKEPPAKSFPIEEEDFTYHPRMANMAMNVKTSENQEPFEILTKPRPVDPNFVPKPILKRRDQPGYSDEKMPRDLSPHRLYNTMPEKGKFGLLGEDKEYNEIARSREDIRLDPGYISRNRAASLTSEKLWTTSAAQERLLETAQQQQQQDKPPSPRQRSKSLIPAKMPAVNLPDRRGSITSAIDTLTSEMLTHKEEPEEIREKPTGIAAGIAAIAGISGLAAASVVIPRHLMDRKKHEEETKVIVDLYSDIVAKHSRKTSYLGSGGSGSPTLKSGSITSLQSISSNNSSNIGTSYKLPSRPPPRITVDDDENEEEEDGGKSEVRSPSQSSGVSSLSETITSSTNSLQKFELSKPNVSRVEDMPRSQSPMRFDKVEDVKIEPPKPQPQPQPQNFNTNTSTMSTNIQNQTVKLPRTSSPMPKSKQEQEKASSSSIEDLASRRGSLPRKFNTSSQKSSTKRKSSPSPLKMGVSPDYQKHQNGFGIRRSISPSPSPSPVQGQSSSHSSYAHRLHVKAPKMREIMTQTSTEKRPPVPLTPKQEELQAVAEIKVKSLVEYLTDLAMFSIACWFYFFSNELYAVPVLLVMIYRQLNEAIKKRIPKWMIDKFKRNKKDN